MATREDGTSRMIKVTIPVTVEIDLAAWRDEYGSGSVAEVRADVKAHVAESIRQHLDSLGVLA